jgi:hypothetical protein
LLTKFSFSSPIYDELIDILAIYDTVHLVMNSCCPPAYLCSERALVSNALPRRKLVPSLSDLFLDYRFSFLGLLWILLLL